MDNLEATFGMIWSAYVDLSRGTLDVESPKIWQDMAGFEAKLAQFQKDTDAAAAAKPADLDAFKAVVGPVLKNCKGCHEDYRVKKN